MIVLVALLFALDGGTQAADRADQFYRAAELEHDGHDAEAAAAFEALVASGPTEPFADDALAELGRLYEERLADPARALAAWERLAKEHPGSRLALRAETRARALRAAMGEGGEGATALAAFNQIMYRYDPARRDEAIADVEALLATAGDAPVAAHATYWLGTLQRDAGRDAAAVARFDEVAARWPASEWAMRSRSAEVELLLAGGEVARAEKVAAGLTGDTRADALARVSKARRRQWAEWAAWGALALLAVVAVVVARGRIVRPPVEVWYLAPVAAVIALAAWSQGPDIGRAVTGIAGGGLAVAWASGAALSGRRVSLARAVVHALCATLAIAAISYLSVARAGLVDTVVETLRFGPDR